MGKRFFTLYESCRQRLAPVNLESFKMFNLLSLAAAHPRDQERRTALTMQREREQAAQLEYQKCSQGLFDRLEKASDNPVP
jgi:hypothetical protein